MTPKEWIYASAQLRCLKCGQIIKLEALAESWAREWCHDEWPKAEELAGWVQAKGIHTCATPTDLQQAREEMKRYRSTHPPLTFEEECKVYNEIIQNQTYL